MALATRKKTQAPPLPSNPQANLDGVAERKPVVTDVATRKSVVDSQYAPLSHLVIHTGGDAWTVDYYRQLNGLDDPLQPLQRGTLPAHQQYCKVERFTLKVDTPLEPVQDPQTKEFQLTGEGAVEYGLIPNKGDMFVADIGSGRVGLFCVSSSERLIDTKLATYRIRYQLVDEYTPVWETDLEGKVVETLVFESSMVELHDSPFMSQAAHRQLLTLNDYGDRISQQFMDRFWSRDVQSLLVPQTAQRLYDGFHAAFCLHLGLGDVLRPIDVYRYGTVDAEDVPTLWGAFMEMDTWPLEDACRKIGGVSVRSFGGTAAYRGVTWSPYEQALYPDGGVPDYRDALKIATAWPIFTDYPPARPPQALPHDVGERHQLTGRLMYPTLSGTSYVLSEAFYEGATLEMSVLELCCWRMLSGESVASELTQVLCEHVFRRPLLEQFYFMPLLLVLIHYCRRGD